VTAAPARSPLVGFQLPYFLAGWQRKLLGGPPLCLTFFVTSACNGRCPHCLAAGRPATAEPELSPAEATRIARSAGRIFNLLVSGGEPFLRDDLVELVTPFHDHARARQITIPTNGSLPERVEAMADRLAAACPRAKVNLRLAVDGPPATHDRIRGIPGGFELVMESARRVEALARRRPNLWLEMCFTLSTLNQEEYPELLAELDRRGVGLSPFILLCRPPTLGPGVWQVSMDSYRRAQRARRERVGHGLTGSKRPRLPVFERVVMAYVDETARRVERVARDPEYRWRCSAGRLALVVDEVGAVYACETLWQPLGRLRELDYDLGRVLAGEPLRELRAARRRGCRCSHETNVTLDASFSLRALATALACVVAPARRRGE
jgi:MoaA/NifB/PqqE/SkfB family radical SAM enzyme